MVFVTQAKWKYVTWTIKHQPPEYIKGIKLFVVLQKMNTGAVTCDVLGRQKRKLSFICQYQKYEREREWTCIDRYDLCDYQGTELEIELFSMKFGVTALGSEEPMIVG